MVELRVTILTLDFGIGKLRQKAMKQPLSRPLSIGDRSACSLWPRAVLGGDLY